MAAVIGYHIGAHAETSNPNPDLIGTLNQASGEYRLSPAEVKKVNKRYQFLSKNRMDHQMRQRRERQLERSSKGANPIDSYKPKTNKKSLEMANAKLKETGQGLSHAEYLI